MAKKGRKKKGKAKHAGNKINSGTTTRNPQNNTQGCGSKAQTPPKNTKIPCDVTLLQVTVATGEGPVADFQATKRRIYEPAPPKAPTRIVTDLSSYDFVIEAVSADSLATDENGAPATKEIASTTIAATWYGSCPSQTHPLVVMHPLANANSSFEKQWQSGSPPKIKMPGPKAGFLAREFAWARFPKVNPMAIEVTAKSCGVRFDKTPVNELKSLLRIYAKDDWTVELKLPALSERKGSGSKKKDLSSGEVTSEVKTSVSSFGSPVSKSEFSATSDSGGKTLKGSETVGDSSSGTYMESSSQFGGDDKPKEEAPEGMPSLTVSRNGAQLDVVKLVNGILNVIRKGKEAFFDFEQLLTIVPKVGYTLDLSFTFLEGSFKYKRGYRVSKTLCGDRYTAVTGYVDVSGAVKIIEASIEMGIGFDITIPNIVDWFATKNIFEVLVKLAGKITLKCEVECTVKVQENTETEVELKPAAGFKVSLVASAMLLGIGIRTETGVKSDGLYLKGKAVFSSDAPPEFSIDTGLASGEAYGSYFWDGVLWDSSGDFDCPLWDAAPFYQGTFPKAP